jgi:hypothetical protein
MLMPDIFFNHLHANVWCLITPVLALILGSSITWPGTLSHAYWSVLFPLLGKNEIMHFCDSPYCVAPSPHTSIGLFHKSEFSECVFFKWHLKLSWFTKCKPIFPKICVKSSILRWQLAWNKRNFVFVTVLFHPMVWKLWDSHCHMYVEYWSR